MPEQEGGNNDVQHRFKNLMSSLYSKNSDEWNKVVETVGALSLGENKGGFLLDPLNYGCCANALSQPQTTIADDNATNDFPSSQVEVINNNEPNWKLNNSTSTSVHERTIRKHVQRLESTLKKISKEDVNYAINLCKKLQKNLIRRHKQLDLGSLSSTSLTATQDTSKDTIIVNNIGQFLQLPSNRSCGRLNYHLEAVLRGIWCSVSGENISSRFLTKRLVGANQSRQKGNQGMKDRKLVEMATSPKSNIFSSSFKQKERVDKLIDVAKKWIYTWQHDENVSRIESNFTATFKVLNPHLKKQEEHQKRSYIEKGGMKMQYDNFKKSQFYTKFVDEIMSDETKRQLFVKRSKLPSISLETFRLCLCRCVGDPTTQSCVDVIQDKVFLSGVAMESFIYKERMAYEKLLIEAEEDEEYESECSDSEDGAVQQHLSSHYATNTFYSKLHHCTCTSCIKYREKFGDSPWTTIFKRNVDSNVASRLVTKCLCPKKTCSDLQFEAEESPPQFHKWACASSNCKRCGIETLPWDCEILSQCTTSIPVQVWEDAKCTGEMTQLEIVDKELPVFEIMEQLKSDLKNYMQHYVDIKLFHRMKDLDVEKQDPSTLLIFTDFATMIDYRANKTLCGHQDHHGVLQIFYVLSNPRNIEIIQNNGETSEKNSRL